MEIRERLASGLVGTVESIDCNQSAKVVVARRVKHPLYGKFLTRSSSFLVHDAAGICEVGAKVKIVPCRPMSKRKRWMALEKLV